MAPLFVPRLRQSGEEPSAPKGPAVALSLVVPGQIHPLLAPESTEAVKALRQGFESAASQVEEARREGADLLLIMSSQWPSILGHQFQAAPRLEWTHVDPEFHELGSVHYDFSFDGPFARAYAKAASARGLQARAIDFAGFPVDTGTIVARKLLDPAGQMDVVTVSCNMYADRAEMVVLGKAASDALAATGRRAVAVAVTGLSSRMIPRVLALGEDRVALARDDEWNRKILEILEEGRLEDVAQLARNFHMEARADQKFKAIWWLSALSGLHNNFEGQVLAYGPIQGTGAAVVSLRPSPVAAAGAEFDEDDVEYFRGERQVLSPAGGQEGTRP